MSIDAGIYIMLFSSSSSCRRGSGFSWPSFSVVCGAACRSRR